MRSFSRFERFLVAVVALLLFCIPVFLWRSTTLVGGDDSGLYYLFPFEYYKNFTTQIIGGNSLGSLGNYYPQLYIAPFALLLSGVHQLIPGLDLQKIFFGLNLAGGFVFFYLLIGQFVASRSRSEILAKATAGLYYVFSLTTVLTLWQNRLFALYLVAIFPLVLWLFLRGVFRHQAASVVAAALALSLWSIVLLSIPWFIGLIIVLVPILLMAFRREPKWFLGLLGLFIATVVLLNFYWLAHLVLSIIRPSGLPNDVLSTVNTISFRQMNVNGIRDVSDHNQLFLPLFGFFHQHLQIDFAWKTYPIFAKWQLPLFPLFSLFVGIILLAAAKIKAGWRYSTVFLAVASAWLLALFFFTVNVGGWGQTLFLFLNAVIPGFTMFRNMYDKFGLALSLTSAMLIAVALVGAAEQLKTRRYRLGLFGVALIVILAGSMPFVLGKYTRNPIWRTDHTIGQVDQLNPDFLDLANFLKQDADSGRVLWLPLNNANYVQIQDAKEPDNYYSGVSPIGFLTGKSDIVGIISFPKAQADRLQSYLLERQYKEVGQLLGATGIHRVIINRNISSDLARSYLFDSRLLAVQDDQFERVLLGQHIRDFGQRYSLYELAPQFLSNTIFLSRSKDSPESIGKVDIQKVSSSRYHVSITGMGVPATLIFSEPFHSQWRLEDPASHEPITGANHIVALGSVNGWELNPTDQTAPFTADISFVPAKYSPIFLRISVASAALVGIYLIWCLLKLLVNRRWPK